MSESHDPRDCNCRDAKHRCPFHGELGPVGAGTPHARMEATWARMELHDDEVTRLVPGWTRLSSCKTFEVAFTEAFAALRSERDTLQAKLDEVSQDLTRARIAEHALSVLADWLIDSDEAGGEMKDYAAAERERMRPGGPGRTIGCSEDRSAKTELLRVSQERDRLREAIRAHLAEIEDRWDGSEQSPLWGLPDDLEAALAQSQGVPVQGGGEGEARKFIEGLVRLEHVNAADSIVNAIGRDAREFLAGGEER